MISKRSGVRFTLLVTVGILVLTVCLTAANTLPDTLSDTEFWSLIERTSEPDGYFRSNSGSTDNLLLWGCGVVGIIIVCRKPNLFRRWVLTHVIRLSS